MASARTARGRNAQLCSSCRKSLAKRDGLCASCFNHRLRAHIRAGERAQAEPAVADPRAARKGKRAVAAAEKKISAQIKQRAKRLQALELKRRQVLLNWHKRHASSNYHEVAAPSGPTADKLRRLDQQIRELLPQPRNRTGGGRPRDPKIDQRVDEATRLHDEQGLSWDRAADRIGIDRRELRRALKRRKLPEILAGWLAKMDREWPPS
jgi:predicted DNA-binding protein (UPF0251 family)